MRRGQEATSSTGDRPRAPISRRAAAAARSQGSAMDGAPRGSRPAQVVVLERKRPDALAGGGEDRVAHGRRQRQDGRLARGAPEAPPGGGPPPAPRPARAAGGPAASARPGPGGDLRTADVATMQVFLERKVVLQKLVPQCARP